jgi:predicted MFS family arabinose efflux permease
MWIELAVLYGIFAVGNILFGHFEERTPRTRRLAKLVAFTALTALIYLVFGRPWSLIWLALPLAIALYVHAIWLPRHGINGLTAEPRERYYALRGWSVQS